MKKNVLLNLAAMATLLCGSSLLLQAQVGSGWSSWSPGYKEQEAGTGNCNGSTFTITSTSTSTEQRAERRYDTFNSGIKQFQGSFKVNSLGGDRICVQQCFRDGQGAYSMIAVDKGRRIYQVSGGASMGTYTIGSNVRINVIANTSTHRVDNYVNGSLKNSKTGSSDPYYFKLGAYRTSSGYGPVSITWSSISFYQQAAKSVEDAAAETQASTLSVACSPSKVTSSAVVTYSLSAAASTKVIVSSMSGKVVKEFALGIQQPGEYTLNLSAEDCAKGMNIITVISGTAKKSCKIVVE